MTRAGQGSEKVFLMEKDLHLRSGKISIWISSWERLQGGAFFWQIEVISNYLLGFFLNMEPNPKFLERIKFVPCLPPSNILRSQKDVISGIIILSFWKLVWQVAVTNSKRFKLLIQNILITVYSLFSASN